MQVVRRTAYTQEQWLRANARTPSCGLLLQAFVASVDCRVSLFRLALRNKSLRASPEALAWPAPTSMAMIAHNKVVRRTALAIFRTWRHGML